MVVPGLAASMMPFISVKASVREKKAKMVRLPVIFGGAATGVPPARVGVAPPVLAAGLAGREGEAEGAGAGVGEAAAEGAALAAAAAEGAAEAAALATGAAEAAAAVDGAAEAAALGAGA